MPDMADLISVRSFAGRVIPLERTLRSIRIKGRAVTATRIIIMEKVYKKWFCLYPPCNKKKYEFSNSSTEDETGISPDLKTC